MTTRTDHGEAPAVPGPPLLNSMKTVVARTDLNRTRLFGHIRDGNLRSFRVGKHRMVTEQALLEFIEWLETQGVQRDRENRRITATEEDAPQQD